MGAPGASHITPEMPFPSGCFSVVSFSFITNWCLVGKNVSLSSESGSSKLIEPKVGMMETSDSQPLSQKHCNSLTLHLASAVGGEGVF